MKLNALRVILLTAIAATMCLYSSSVSAQAVTVASDTKSTEQAVISNKLQMLHDEMARTKTDIEKAESAGASAEVMNKLAIRLDELIREAKALESTVNGKTASSETAPAVKTVHAVDSNGVVKEKTLTRAQLQSMSPEKQKAILESGEFTILD